MATEPPQFRAEMEASWKLIEDNYDAVEIFGEKATQMLVPLAVRASHHELPLALSLMAGLAACSNGACVQVFPGSLSPLMMCVLNVNYPQTRKSAAFSILNKIGHAIDTAVLSAAQRAERHLLQEDAEAEGGGQPSRRCASGPQSSSSEGGQLNSDDVHRACLLQAGFRRFGPSREGQHSRSLGFRLPD